MVSKEDYDGHRLENLTQDELYTLLQMRVGNLAQRGNSGSKVYTPYIIHVVDVLNAMCLRGQYGTDFKDRVRIQIKEIEVK